MAAEEVLYTALANAGAVTAIVGTRIDPDVSLDAGLPAIAFQNPETEYTVTIHDILPAAVEPQIELWCMAATRKAADELAEVVVPVVAGAGFRVTNRKSAIDEGPPLSYAAVLTVEALE